MVEIKNMKQPLIKIWLRVRTKLGEDLVVRFNVYQKKMYIYIINLIIKIIFTLFFSNDNNNK